MTIGLDSIPVNPYQTYVNADNSCTSVRNGEGSKQGVGKTDEIL